MADQVSSLCKKGMKAIHVSGNLNETVVSDIHQGKFQALFFSPEQLLQNTVWRDMLLSSVYEENLVGFVVDEAHCVKKWGTDFRKEFSHLGEVRSLLPDGTHLMALTATATHSSRRKICNVLGMEKVAIVSESPDRPKIEYALKINRDPIEVTFAPLVEELRRERCFMGRVIVFCRSYDDAGYVYAFFRSRLLKEAVDPMGAPDLCKYRLVDLFTACTPKNVKDTIVENFCTTGSKLRVIIATIAFGMGLNCADIRRIIHWGPPGDVESYLQETGRAGRDGLPSSATLYVGPHDLRSPHLEDSIKIYCKNSSTCRREVLLRDFDNAQDEQNIARLGCCDVCNMKFVLKSNEADIMNM